MPSNSKQKRKRKPQSDGPDAIDGFEPSNKRQIHAEASAASSLELDQEPGIEQYARAATRSQRSRQDTLINDDERPERSPERGRRGGSELEGTRLSTDHFELVL